MLKDRTLNAIGNKAPTKSLVLTHVGEHRRWYCSLKSKAEPDLDGTIKRSAEPKQSR